MNYRELSKFQIKAEITLMLQKLASQAEISREQQINCLSRLGAIKDNDSVVEILAKELRKVDYKQGQIIIMLLQELGELEQLSDILWGYIKSPDSSDELRDLSGIILKNLGDNTDPEEFLNYLDNPKAVVDKETKKLLEVAAVNPEAQIDFLDFLFSLPESEQINLIKSLREDYSSEHLVNVAISAFESRLICHMDEFFIKILGETKSPKAAFILKDFLSYSQDEKLNKKVQISINTLKLAGINIDDEKNLDLKAEITRVSDPYEFHTNIPDGLGNQAIVAGRIRANGDILMMNAVVNDVHGLLDCFGFYGISKRDFRRIINKFQEKSTGFPVSAEYCQYILTAAERINKNNNLPLPYEYIAWKSILSDINPIKFSEIEKLTDSWVNENLINEGHLLYKFPDFKHWFFEEEDHETVKNILKKIINNIIEKKELYIKDSSELEEVLESSLNNLMSGIYSHDIRQMYKHRLQNIAFLFNIDELRYFRNIAASLAWLIDPKNNCAITNNDFFREIMKTTIIEGLLRHQYNLDNEEKRGSQSWASRKKDETPEKTLEKIEKQSIKEIIGILCGN